MAASFKTVESVIRVVEKHVDKKTLWAIVDDLKKVEGNKSFVETVRRIEDKIITEGARNDPENPPVSKEWLERTASRR